MGCLPPPASIKSHPKLFVVLWVGEAMNRPIPDGAWCLFRAPPPRKSEDQVVLAQHRSISPRERGAIRREALLEGKGATVKGERMHRRMTPSPNRTGEVRADRDRGR